MQCGAMTPSGPRRPLRPIWIWPARCIWGKPPDFSLDAGQCAQIGTGGMLPPGADAVVMVEHTRSLDQATIEVTSSLAPGAHVLKKDDDAGRGQTLLPAGHRLRPQDVGLLAALGLRRVRVRQRPRVGIISTGDEVVPVEQIPAPGQVRDVNTHTLHTQIMASGGRPVALGLAPDDRERLIAQVADSLRENHLTLLSGGSSVGARDLTAEVFMTFEGARLLVHGVSVSPGKPFIWVQAGGRQLMGLPGQVASCLVSFYLFVEPVMERLLGRPARPFSRFGRIKALLSRPVPSAPGREEFVRARLVKDGDALLAEPVFGKSGLLSSLVQSQGLLTVPAESEGLYAGDEVEVLLFPEC